MNCEVAHERIVTAAYGELPDEQAHELEQHVEGCEDCRAEREQVAALQVLAAALPVQEPDANLIARARMRLDEALDALPPRRWYERLAQRTRNGFAGLRAAPVAAGLLLAIGAGAGSFGGYHYALGNRAPLAARTVMAMQTSQPAARAQTGAGNSGRHLRCGQRLERGASSEQRSCGCELQPACAAPRQRLARRSIDPATAHDGQPESGLGTGARGVGEHAGLRVPHWA